MVSVLSVVKISDDYELIKPSKAQGADFMRQGPSTPKIFTIDLNRPRRFSLSQILFHSIVVLIKKIMKRASFVAVFVLLLTLGVTPAFAGTKKKRTSPAPKNQPPVISSIAGNTVTVTEGKTTRAFTVTQFTEVTVNGQRATIADLKPGMTANVTIGMDPTHAARINATGVATDDKHKKKK